MDRSKKKLDEIMENVPIENERFASLEPSTAVEIEGWREIVKDNFPELVLPAEIGLSVIAQLLIEDIKNPFSLVYVDVPSSGKTITINFFSGLKELMYTTDNFTPASFVSHSANTSKKDLGKNDMLPQIRYKTLVIRDLAPIFAKNDEDVQAMLGILIRILDGEGLETNSGLYGKRGYTGDYLFMMLSASTPIRPRIWKVMGNLGSRLFFINIEGTEKSETELVDQLRYSCRDKEFVCRQVTEDLIKTLWNKYPTGINWDKQKDDQNLMRIIARLAKILAKLRSSINVWEENVGSKKYNHTQPITEMPNRLNQLIYNVTRGHALVCGRETLAVEDLCIALRVTLDSAPPNRSKIFKHLMQNNGHLNTTQIMDILKCSRPTALRSMEEMGILEIVETYGNMEDETMQFVGRPEQTITLCDKYKWFATEECLNLYRDSEKLKNKSDLIN